MATLYWKGCGPAVAQVTTITPAGTLPNQTFTLTVGDTSLSYTAGASDTATDIAQALADMWNASTHVYHTSITASQDADIVTLTSDIPGVPFVVTASATGSATLTVNTTTVNRGPHDWSTPANWSTGSLPTNGDTVIFENSSVPVLFGLDQSAVTLAALHIKQSYVGKIGLDDTTFTVDENTTQSSQCEYRDTYLAIGASSVDIGQYTGSSTPAGSSRIKLNTGMTQTTLQVHNTASIGADSHQQPVRWIGNHANNVVGILRGKLGIANNLPNESATVSDLFIGQAGSLGSDATVIIGSGVTLTHLHQAGGSVLLGCDATNIQQSAGVLTTVGSLTLNQVTIAGQADLMHIGDITKLIVAPEGQVDFSHQSAGRTVADCDVYNGATLHLDNGNPLSISFTNGINCVQSQPQNVTINWWPNIRLNASAIL
ncbi:MAG: hypothetical protein ACF8OB_10185 [Phycisphaeraceae bacterium JB051]